MHILPIVALVAGIPLAVEGATYTLTTSYEGSNLCEQNELAELADELKLSSPIDSFPQWNFSTEIDVNYGNIK